MRLACCMLAGLAALAPNLRAGSLLLQQGLRFDSSDRPYEGTSDTTIRWQSDRNYGGLNALNLGGDYKILLRFDLAALHGKSLKIRQALLTLTRRSETALGQEMPVRLAALTPANAGWQAGRQANAVAAPGEVSWLWRSRGEADDTHVPWASGGHFTAKDVVEPALARDSVRPDLNQWTVEIPAEVAQSWIDDPASNAGLIIESEDVEKRERNSEAIVSFRQSSYKNLGERPSLRLDYEED